MLIFALFVPTAILAGLDSWLFMVPPLTPGTFKVAINAPLMSWGIMERFDSADDCERERSHLIGRVHDQSWLAEREKEYRSLGSQDLRPDTGNLTKKTFEAAKCISASDPRLKR
jgi:hypothetical protein